MRLPFRKLPPKAAVAPLQQQQQRFRTFSLFKASFGTVATTAIAKPVDEVDLRAETGTTANLLDRPLANVVRPFYNLQKPLVVRGVVESAPATTKWSSWDYWWQTFENHVGGVHLDDGNGTVMVSVEMGGSYGSAQSERAEIPLQSYLQYLELFEERHGRTGSEQDSSTSLDIAPSELVFMAQNDLPAPLHADIMIPAFCQHESMQVGLGRLYSTMLWLGPRGCVSPLHYDPLDNCLMQHVGRKRVVLYEPSPTGTTRTRDKNDDDSQDPAVTWHYAGHEGQQSNTSPVDVEAIDLIKYPLFRHAPKPFECILRPGDLLFIPSKWWHFVRSIDASASVNVWWR